MTYISEGLLEAVVGGFGMMEIDVGRGEGGEGKMSLMMLDVEGTGLVTVEVRTPRGRFRVHTAAVPVGSLQEALQERLITN